MKTLTIRFKGDDMKKVYYADRYAFNPIGAEGFLLIESGTHLTYFDLDVIEELDIEGGKTNE